MENNNRRKLGTYQICLIALAIVMNVIGGQIALALRLPIYLDSIGTIMIGAMLGPWCGLIPGLLGGLIMAFTGDIYSLYFAPVGMIVGFMSGLAHTGFSGLRGGAKLQRILSLGHISTVKDAAIMIGRAFMISLPGTVVSAFICTSRINTLCNNFCCQIPNAGDLCIVKWLCPVILYSIVSPVIQLVVFLCTEISCSSGIKSNLWLLTCLLCFPC